MNTHPDKYPGSNQLGLILSELRHELMSKPTDDIELMSKPTDIELMSKPTDIELMSKPTDIDIDEPVTQDQSNTTSVEKSTAPITRPSRPSVYVYSKV